ncbi:MULTISPECIES: Uxx-star family glutaredoxin-like (seleno)protein [unclassified Methanoregula]|uniref:Uxx-star family glutaredoxin-like (seleno)protein n=1 Tax=unclassified Methanoregula TaxID=2649730 RepID=UPI0009D044F9|nr:MULTISPECIES: Uxx-star family glutaredoxin-like (seleno)protein [unclassified Methanoregula]OPX64246.1 MAG: Sulfide dehydrogenase subunit alpha precursor [Methanoregula sp. PtaB.Bin085]OPY33629.1 MAG: Sulfide dehydrogenase subunit alpha precursor [Methanoregula sp. PtaU1.Bin006]
MTRVTVYSTQNCPYCRMAKAFLEKHGVPYESIDVGADRAQAEKMIALSGQRGVPVIVVDDEVIVGFDSQRLNELFGETREGGAYDVLIVGAGPAGLTAGMYCARKMLSTLIISENIGGQALESWAVENYMGYRMVSGEELMKKFEEQVRMHDIRLEIDRAAGFSEADGVFRVSTTTGQEFFAKTIIFAQGKRPRKLDVLGEDRFIGRGISICSTCDGPLFKGKKVAVVGGGNSALQTAIEMSSIAASVSLIVRSSIKADAVYVEKLKGIGNITVHEHTKVTALHGEQFLTGVTIRDEKGSEQQLPLDGVFVEIGWLPNTDILDGFVALNEQKEIIVDINCHTNRPGVFAAGDITNEKSKQIIIAAGDGAKAALEAFEYLMKEGKGE